MPNKKYILTASRNSSAPTVLLFAILITNLIITKMKKAKEITDAMIDISSKSKIKETASSNTRNNAKKKYLYSFSAITSTAEK